MSPRPGTNLAAAAAAAKFTWRRCRPAVPISFNGAEFKAAGALWIAAARHVIAGQRRGLTSSYVEIMSSNDWNAWGTYYAC